MFKTYDEASAALEEIVREIQSTSSELANEMPEPLYTQLSNLEREIDNLAGSALTLLERQAHLFGPTETTFDMTATISVSWDRETKSPRSLTLELDRGWAPSTVFDDEGTSHPSDDSQCIAWNRVLCALDNTDLIHLT